MSVSIVCVCVYLCKHNNFTESAIRFWNTQTYDNSSKYGHTWLLYKGREREGERKSSAESLITGSIRDWDKQKLTLTHTQAMTLLLPINQRMRKEDNNYIKLIIVSYLVFYAFINSIRWFQYDTAVVQCVI